MAGKREREREENRIMGKRGRESMVNIPFFAVH